MSNLLDSVWRHYYIVKVKIPTELFQVEYKSHRIPGIDHQSDLSLGANCQLFAYELLRVNGLVAKNDRSSELCRKMVDAGHPRNAIGQQTIDDSQRPAHAIRLGEPGFGGTHEREQSRAVKVSSPSMCR